jgi:hypothetical protein
MGTTRIQLDPVSALFKTSAFPAIVANQGTNFPVGGLAFDASTKETAFFHFRADNYGSGNVTLTLRWYADTASSGDVVYGAQLAVITPDTDTQDVETKALATANTVTDSHLGTVGQRLHTCDVTITNLDSLASGDEVWLAVYRDAAAGGDTMTGDAIVVGIEVSYSDT